jgi:hypothetical protein
MRTPRIAEIEVVAPLRGDAFFGCRARPASRDRSARRRAAPGSSLVAPNDSGLHGVSLARHVNRSVRGAREDGGARERVEAFAQQPVERADAVRSRKSRSPNGRGDFGPRDPSRA